NADDSADPIARTVTLDTFVNGFDVWQSIAGLAPGLITYDGYDSQLATISAGSGGNTINVLHTVAGNRTFNLNTGSGVDTVNVQSTGTGNTLDINGNAGNDAVNITSAGSVAGIAGPVIIENHSSFSNITVDDSADTLRPTVILSRFLAGTVPWGRLTGLAPADITYKYSEESNLTLMTGNPITVKVLATGGASTAGIPHTA